MTYSFECREWCVAKEQVLQPLDLIRVEEVRAVCTAKLTCPHDQAIVRRLNHNHTTGRHVTGAMEHGISRHDQAHYGCLLALAVVDDISRVLPCAPLAHSIFVMCGKRMRTQVCTSTRMQTCTCARACAHMHVNRHVLLTHQSNHRRPMHLVCVCADQVRWHIC